MQRRDVLDRPVATVDPKEVAYYERLATEWWNPEGRFRAMHRFNPVRRDEMLRQAAAHFCRAVSDPVCPRPDLSGLTVLDIGCGGGLLSEPFARCGAEVVGIDATAKSIEVARRHGRRQGLDIRYRHALTRTLVAEKQTFDIVLNAEVVEHVADVPDFLTETAALVAPGGTLFVGTLNRTLRSFLAAIVVGEYIAKLLPRGTHDWRRFQKPAELDALLTPHGLTRSSALGISYNPFRDRWSLTNDLGINYMLRYERPPARR